MSAIQIEGGCDFIIDPGSAKALRDDLERLKPLDELLSAAEEQEQSNLRARIAERARAIGCPAHYGPRQALKDQNRLYDLRRKRISPPSFGGGALSEAEDVEEAQLTARVAAFEESAEGRARNRILELTYASFSRGLSGAETKELEGLRKVYPDLPPDPNDPLYEWYQALERVSRGEDPVR